MNRRDFFFMVSGGLVVGRGCSSRPEFPPEKILEIDEEGIVHPWEPGTMLSYDPKTRTILRVRKPFPPLECEDVDDDPRHCRHCGQYPCDCWRDV